MRRTTRRVTAAATLAVVAFTMLGIGSSRAVEGPYPGLPAPEVQPPPASHRTFGGAALASLAKAETAKQWLRTPVMVTAFDFYISPTTASPDPARYRACSTGGGNVYLVAPSGSPHNYGISPDITVRTLAFGAIPVEATVRLEQRRADGLPVPLVGETTTCALNIPDGGRQALDTVIDDELHTRVTSLVVDGVRIRLGDTCRTAVPGAMHLRGKGYLAGWDGNQQVDPPKLPLWDKGLFNLSTGGRLTGTIDVPRFGGCVTADGDDLSSLLTATVSGSAFPLSTNQGSAFGCTKPKPGGGTLPPGPGESTVESVPCNPGNAASPLIPPALEIPESDR
ncbi:hypothetical protein ACFU7D_22190 [Nocardioides sp. NPDC057577]|uniref:hypothetical protein n=1 Tax=Nocardioides sp. NPDC057577 TaxID=3346171 RepID=UPI00366C3C1A